MRPGASPLLRLLTAAREGDPWCSCTVVRARPRSFDWPASSWASQVLEDGEWWLAVETTADRVGCPACGVRAVGHGRRRVQVRDLPIAGRPVRLVWAKRIWSCGDPDCPTGTWTETSELIESRASLTVRARSEICRRVGEDGDSVAAVARRVRRRVAHRDGRGARTRPAPGRRSGPSRSAERARPGRDELLARRARPAAGR